MDCATSSDNNYYNGKSLNNEETQNYFNYLTTFQNELCKQEQVKNELHNILDLIKIDVEEKDTKQDIQIKKLNILKDIVKKHLQN